MQDNLRKFQVADPFGRNWLVEFRWHQNAISIRHADAIDCKYYISDGASQREIVVSLEHAGLLRIAAKLGREVSDPWCMRLAAAHLRRMISTWEDMDRTIATVPATELEAHAQMLALEDAEARERAALVR